jgi:hypothetical protein
MDKIKILINYNMDSFYNSSNINFIFDNLNIKNTSYNNSNFDFNNIDSLILRRNQRNQLLEESDKYLLKDYPITPENLILITEYRQQLRDYMKREDVINYKYSYTTPIPSFPKFPF